MKTTILGLVLASGLNWCSTGTSSRVFPPFLALNAPDCYLTSAQEVENRAVESTDER